MPPLLAPVLDYVAEFLPLPNWNGLEIGFGVPPERELSPECILGQELSPESHNILPPNTAPEQPGWSIPTSPHRRGSLRFASGEREISCPPMELEFAHLTGPLRLFAAI